MPDFITLQSKLKTTLDKSTNILITMSSPDGDSVASAIAIKSILEQLGKKTHIICSFDLGGRFDTYPGVSDIIIADLARIDFSKYDACFTVDAGQLARLVKSELQEKVFAFPKSLEVVNIDHHQTNDLFGTLNVNVPTAPCTAFVIDKLFTGMYSLDSFIATLFYFSVVNDTVNFRYHYNSPEDLFLFAARCIKNGADIQMVLDDFLNTRVLSQTKYEAVLLQRLEQKKNFIYTMAYHDDLEKYNIDVSQFLSATATIARDYLSSFKEADFGWVISERKSDIVKIEMRSKVENSPILGITQALGGGGHKKACGAKVTGQTLEEVQSFILKYLDKLDS